MANSQQDHLTAAVGSAVDPFTGVSLQAAKTDYQVAVNDHEVQVTIKLGYPVCGAEATWQAAIEKVLASEVGEKNITVILTSEIVAHAVQKNVQPLPEVKNIIAVASGKGGVGKSTTSVNLALALARQGVRVGLLDADIYGPSQPMMLGQADKPTSKDGKIIEPLVRHDIQAMSIGYLIDQEAPMVWRGPMVTQALEQLLRDTHWHELDYLLIDLPPGTGDIQLTLAQRVPVSGAVIVTTPQDISLLDARRALNMFRKVNVAVLGVIENMSTHICSQCGHEDYIFGADGGRRMAEQYDVPLLGQVPLDRRIREQADGGRPTVVAEPEDKLAHAFHDIARKTAAQLALQTKNLSVNFPKIVVSDT